MGLKCGAPSTPWGIKNWVPICENGSAHIPQINNVETPPVTKLLFVFYFSDFHRKTSLLVLVKLIFNFLNFCTSYLIILLNVLYFK